VDGPAFRTPHLGGPLALPSVIVGIAIAGLEEFARMTNTRWSRLGGNMAELPSMQMRIGESAVEIDAALALLRAKLRELMAKNRGEAVDFGSERALLPPGGAAEGHDRAVSGFIAYKAYAALERLMVAAGAGQLAQSAPFQRCYRDALAGIQQPSTNWDAGRVSGGRDLLGRLGGSGIV
jgi:hypothetical protein